MQAQLIFYTESVNWCQYFIRFGTSRGRRNNTFCFCRDMCTCWFSSIFLYSFVPFLFVWNYRWNLCKVEKAMWNIDLGQVYITNFDFTDNKLHKSIQLSFRSIHKFFLKTECKELATMKSVFERTEKFSIRKFVVINILKNIMTSSLGEFINIMILIVEFIWKLQFQCICKLLSNSHSVTTKCFGNENIEFSIIIHTWWKCILCSLLLRNQNFNFQ